MSEAEKEADLDSRELQWFEQNRGWTPGPNDTIGEWLMEMREKDEALCDKGCFPSGHFEETHKLREAVDRLNDYRKSLGLEPMTEEQALK